MFFFIARAAKPFPDADFSHAVAAVTENLSHLRRDNSFIMEKSSRVQSPGGNKIRNLRNHGSNGRKKGSGAGGQGEKEVPCRRGFFTQKDERHEHFFIKSIFRKAMLFLFHKKTSCFSSFRVVCVKNKSPAQPRKGRNVPTNYFLRR